MAVRAISLVRPLPPTAAGLDDVEMGPRANLVTGAVVGYVASRVMDVATSAYYARQSEESRQREVEIAPHGTLVDLGQMLGGAVGRDLPPEQAGKVGLMAHRTLGVTYGVIASVLVNRGMAPVLAGGTVGLAAWVVVDEGLSLPTFSQYKPESHIRGLIGHSTWGLTAGLLLSLTSR
jgi:hypothetical protein